MKLRLIMVTIILYSAALFGAQPAATTVVAAAANEPEKVEVATTEVKKKAPKRELVLEEFTGLPKELASIIGEYAKQVDVNDPAIKMLWYTEIKIDSGYTVTNFAISPDRKYAVFVTKKISGLLESIGLTADSYVIYIYCYEKGAWKEIAHKKAPASISYISPVSLTFLFSNRDAYLYAGKASGKTWVLEPVSPGAKMSENGRIYIQKENSLTIYDSVLGMNGLVYKGEHQNIRHVIDLMSWNGRVIVWGKDIITLDAGAKSVSRLPEKAKIKAISEQGTYVIAEVGEEDKIYSRRDTNDNTWSLQKILPISAHKAFTIEADVVAINKDTITIYSKKNLWEMPQEACVDCLNDAAIWLNGIGDVACYKNSSIEIIASSVLRDILNLTDDQVVFLQTIYKRHQSKPKSPLILTDKEVEQFGSLPKTVGERVIQVYGLPIGQPKG